jgi:two-component system NtrC family response regulator/two-component system response regulator HydG
MERALIVSRSDSLRAEDLPLRPPPEARAASGLSTLADIEKEAILETLSQNNGDRRKTAEQLGISLRKLQYRLKEYGLTER